MDSRDVDKLLEQGFAGAAPGAAFRARALQDSLAALGGVQRRRARWRIAVLSAAAVLIAGVSFLGGRYSVVRRETEAPPGAPPVATSVGRADRTVVVSNELVAWVNAARLFKQLGMEDRVGRALDRAGRLMPPGTVGPGAGTKSAFTSGEATGAGREEHPDETGRPDRPESFSVMNRIMAQSLGD